MNSVLSAETIIKCEMYLEKLNALWGKSKSGAFIVENLLIFRIGDAREGVWQHIKVGRDPFGDPHELVQDLL